MKLKAGDKVKLSELAFRNRKNEILRGKIGKIESIDRDGTIFVYFRSVPAYVTASKEYLRKV